MAANFTGNWKLVESQNFDEYLQALGVDADKRKIVVSASPRHEIQQDGDSFTVKTTGLQNKTISFKLGGQFEDELPSGKVKVVPTLVGGKLHFEIEGPKGKMTTDREIRADGRLYMVMTAGNGTTCTRIFARE
ncbi:cellular retinoic acid-binding protein 2-like [Branchiostoma floridae]|uniref:Cellular retinoic acid-binding protein 2-like n=1 Tax=Branchiostoma floridae TaxID=7739 RepID=A0A9J7HH73_BRAFL|nr:cellular retinoic acid-binding protein 2-like [Branchiostoma floridae]